MTKKEIFEKLKEINIDTSKFVIIGEASIVCHGIIKNTDSIEIESLVSINVSSVNVKVVKKLDKSNQINDYYFQKPE